MGMKTAKITDIEASNSPAVDEVPLYDIKV